MSGLLFVDPSDGGAWSPTQPDFHLTRISAAFSTGTWLATVTSSSGSGTSFKVNNAGWFFAGLTAAGHVVPGDSIQLQGRTRTATIQSISGNTITFTPSPRLDERAGCGFGVQWRCPNVGALSTLVDNTMSAAVGTDNQPATLNPVQHVSLRVRRWQRHFPFCIWLTSLIRAVPKYCSRKTNLD